MTFETKMRKIGNDLLSKKAKNPYFVETKNIKKKVPLWAKISIPSTLATIAAVLAIVLVETNRGGVNLLENNRMNYPNKAFNSQQETLSQHYVESIKNFAEEYYTYLYRRHYTSQVYHGVFDARNFVFSPISMANTMYSLYDGATGETKREIEELIGIREEQFDHLKEANKMIRNISTDYKDNKERHIFSNVSQGLFIDDSIKDSINQNYIDTLTNYYYSDVFHCKMRSVESEQLYKDYMIAKTNGNSGSDWIVDEQYVYDQAIRLLDVFYIESNWGIEFEEMPRGPYFTNYNSTHTDDVTFIKSKTRFLTNIYENERLLVISIPLLKDFAFNILLPKSNTEYQDVLQNHLSDLLNFSNENQLLVNAKISMPTFTYSNINNYNNCLDTVFASYDNICHETKVFVEGLGNQASINVNCNGIMSSSTDAMGNELPAEGEITPEGISNVDFLIDKPFSFSITSPNMMPLLIGQIQKL